MKLSQEKKPDLIIRSTKDGDYFIAFGRFDERGIFIFDGKRPSEVCRRILVSVGEVPNQTIKEIKIL